ncbi:alpha/beta hydrolase [Rhodococcus sp. LB1]|uniref:alpha/beta hydrolase n=1 Tax=Rhodococcus sp. LB1 TaxID=1807499 RepID=UPI00077B22B2|nr:alpha/beta hydrolase [Rhodococcus sp. LB1]KXX54136.1 esterase [Rhodococcus sp. LB1]TQC48172.1 alpha/beta hydrolase [Rhodococcus sp. WS4]
MAKTRSDALLKLFQSMAERAASNPNMDLTMLRNMMEELHLQSSEPEKVCYEEVSAGGVPAMWCNPEGAAEDRVLLFTHGGGFVTNSMHSHRKVVGHLAGALGVRALTLDYRRAPENPYPSQLEDAKTAYKWLLSEGVAANRIVTAGDSAGGNLATSVVLALRDEGVALPAAVIGFSPWYDMELVGESMDSNASSDAFVQREILNQMATLFLGEHGSRTDPLANPLHANLEGFPPVFLTAGGDETLLSDSERFAKMATDAGVETVLTVVPGMQHIYIMMAGRAHEADDIVGAVAEWVRPKLDLS